MTEFGENWIGWEFGVAHEDLVNIMSRPDGGLALVEVDARPARLVTELGSIAMNAPWATKTREALYMNQYGDGSPSSVYASTVGWHTEFPELQEATIVEDMQTLLSALSSILDPIRDNLGAPSEAHFLHMVFGLRHRHKGHLDPDFVRAWCGANRPGFFVFKNDEKIWIPSLPEGYVLLMRGGDYPTLEGIRHGATYRSSKVRRVALLGI